jgi:hypothetical protein
VEDPGAASYRKTVELLQRWCEGFLSSTGITRNMIQSFKQTKIASGRLNSDTFKILKMLVDIVVLH